MSRMQRSCSRNRVNRKPAGLPALRLPFPAVGQGADRKSPRSRQLRGNGCQFAFDRCAQISRHGHLQGSPGEIPGIDRTDRRGVERLRNARRYPGGDCGHGFRFSCGHHGFSRGRTYYPCYRARNGRAHSHHHHLGFGWRAHVRRHAQSHANGKDQRRARPSRRSPIALYFCSDESDDGRSDGELRLAWRHYHRRAEKHDRVRGTTSDQGNDAPGSAQRISDGRVSRGTRFDRSDRASKKIAVANRRVPALLCANGRVNYREALAWLYATQRFGIKLGLENIERLLRSLSFDFAHPDPGSARAWRAVSGASPETFSCQIIHVAGTNGKGSVCAMIDAIARTVGHRTGLFTSPHLVSFRERIRVNGENISEDEVAAGLTEIRELIGNWNPHPTFFEIATALALQHFQKTHCEIVVLETGMGGRLDATNAVQSAVSVITPIDFDHEKWLGHSIAEIAKEKAGITKPRTPVVSAPQRPEAEAIIRQRAEECIALLQFVNEPWTKTKIALHGEHQKMNAAVG